MKIYLGLGTCPLTLEFLFLCRKIDKGLFANQFFELGSHVLAWMKEFINVFTKYYSKIFKQNINTYVHMYSSQWEKLRITKRVNLVVHECA